MSSLSYRSSCYIVIPVLRSSTLHPVCLPFLSGCIPKEVMPWKAWKTRLTRFLPVIKPHCGFHAMIPCLVSSESLPSPALSPNTSLQSALPHCLSIYWHLATRVSHSCQARIHEAQLSMAFLPLTLPLSLSLCGQHQKLEADLLILGSGRGTH